MGLSLSPATKSYKQEQLTYPDTPFSNIMYFPYYPFRQLEWLIV